jgi:dihydrofolate reductase
MKKILIAAVSKNNVIGNDAKIPWRSKEELTHFKNTTLGSAVIMGRKTWESIKKPLAGRLNIIITSNEKYSVPFHEAIIFFSIKQAIEFLRTSIYEKVFIIGGREVFDKVIDDVDEIILSEMNFEAEGDVYFPEIDWTKWVLESNELFTDFTVHHYIRKAE